MRALMTHVLKVEPDRVKLRHRFTIENLGDFRCFSILAVSRHLGQRIDSQRVQHPTAIVSILQSVCRVQEVDA